MKKDLSILFNEYLESRKSDPNHSESTFRRKLQLMRKSESEIHETLLEFNNEWENEFHLSKSIKKSNRNILIGFLLSIGTLLFQFIASKGYFGNPGNAGYAFFGVGLMKLYYGLSERKEIKNSIKRKEIKWKSW